MKNVLQLYLDYHFYWVSTSSTKENAFRLLSQQTFKSYFPYTRTNNDDREVRDSQSFPVSYP